MKDLHYIEFSRDIQFLFERRSSSFKIKGEKYRYEKCNNAFYKHFAPAIRSAQYNLDLYREDPAQFYSSEEHVEDSDENQKDQNIIKKLNQDLKDDQATVAAHVPLFEEGDSHSDNDCYDSDSSSNENWQKL